MILIWEKIELDSSLFPVGFELGLFKDFSLDEIIKWRQVVNPFDIEHEINDMFLIFSVVSALIWHMTMET